MVGFRHKSSQRPFLLQHRIRALLLQLQCIWDTSPLLFRTRQPLNGAVLIAEYPVSSPFHDGEELSQALYLGKGRVVGLVLPISSFGLSNGLEELLYQNLGKITTMKMCSHFCSPEFCYNPNKVSWDQLGLEVSGLHRPTPQLYEGSFPWFCKVVAWLCQLMHDCDEAKPQFLPLLSGPFRGCSSTHVCMAYSGQWTMHCQYFSVG